ncbi:MAG: MFS transporter [Propionibacteriales bacterium]|nr:MFS transporter [Propionibacteriales bacterium]
MTRVTIRGRLSALLTDIRPLQVSPDYRRLWFGTTVAQLGQQMATVAIAIQVYDITRSSFSVGLVGLFSLVPLVFFGLYGGAIADAMDRRRLALVASTGLWLLSLVLVLQAVLGLHHVGLLYVVVAVQSACFAVNNPARSAIIPRLLPRELLPAANALSMASFNLGFTVGPLVGAYLIHVGDFALAYGVDAVTFTASLYALFRLPPIPPEGAVRRAGLASVLEGLRFLRTAPNLRTSFIADMCAMVLAHPRALFPAMALTVYAGTEATVGLLQSAPAIGALVAFLLSGWVSRIRLHGRAIVVAVVVYGLAVGAVGLSDVLWFGVAFLAVSGAADMVSAAYRSTMLQAAAPDAMRGRLQGVFTVVVAGGPRAGDFVLGSVASVTSERGALMIGGLACVVGVLITVLLQRRFLTYDARHPIP